MSPAKREVTDLLAALPDEVTLEQIQYHLYVRQKILRGLKDAEEGRVCSQEDVEKRMRKWIPR